MPNFDPSTYHQNNAKDSNRVIRSWIRLRRLSVEDAKWLGPITKIKAGLIGVKNRFVEIQATDVIGLLTVWFESAKKLKAGLTTA